MEKQIFNLVEKLAICEAMCNYCFNACLYEKDVHMMAECIRLDKACAEVCSTTLSIVSSQSILTKKTLQLCITVCEKCAAECGKHAYDHCKQCAKACEECARSCQSFLDEQKAA